ncbi:MAG: restriction endonuclease subunit S [Agriterribacter sp.]
MILTNWKYFKINSIFDIKKGKRLTKENMIPGTTPFIGAIDKANGCSQFILQEPNHKANTITVTYNGSVAEAFYQPVAFWASDDVNVLYPKFPLTRDIALFICTIIKKEKYRFNYGRKWHVDRMKESQILLPADKEGNLDYEYMGKFINDLPELKLLTDKTIFNSVNNSSIKLDTSKWKRFKYGGKDGIFIIKNGYYNKKPEHSEIGTIPFIGATEYDNGITEYYSLDEIDDNNKDDRSNDHDLTQKIFKGNCVTVTNNGSVGCAFYQPKDFTCSHDVNVLLLNGREWNVYLAMFICTIIELEKFRWTFGRKWRPARMPDSDIKLPVTKSGQPDWDFMENYIKSITYSASLLRESVSERF